VVACRHKCPARLSYSTGCILLAAVSLLFLASNRAAYRSYFQDDDMANLSWAPLVPTTEFVRGLLSPLFQRNNFRPAAHLYYHVMGRVFGLDFPKYVFAIHALHLLNVWLVWLLARRLGACAFAASVAAIFFALHMASFGVYWRPMFVFDLICGSFCLLSFLLFIQRRMILSFVAFWLAYKSKELAVMLPAVLAMYEFWFGKRQWQPLVPFVAASLSFGLQGFLFNPNVDNNYTFRFTLPALSATTRFYSSNILLFHHAGFVMVPAALWLGRARVRFGILAMLLLMLPLLVLPGRLSAAYCYVPVTGLALAIAGSVNRKPLVVGLVFSLVWVGWNFMRLSRDEPKELAIADENRSYIHALLNAFPSSFPEIRSFVFDGGPSAFAPWGIRGTLEYAYHRTDIEVGNAEAVRVGEHVLTAPTAVLRWNADTRTLSAGMWNP
jgi:hypothetical protein